MTISDTAPATLFATGRGNFRFASAARVCDQIAAATELDAALHAACTALVDLVGKGHAAVVLLSADRGRGILRAEYPETGVAGAEISLRQHPRLQERVRTRAPLQFSDVSADDVLEPVRGLLEQAGVRALLLVPVVRGERLLGWLSVHDTAGARVFDEDEVVLCQVIARQVAVAVENANFKEQALLHSDEMQTLRQANIAIGSLLQLDERDKETLLNRVVEQAVAALQAKSGGLYRYSPEQDQLTLVADYLRPHHRGTKLRPGEGLAGRLVQSELQYVTESNYRGWEGRAGVFEDETSFGAVLEVLLRWQGKITGVLYIDDDAGRRFTADEAARLGLLADQAAMVLANTELRARFAERDEAQQAQGGVFQALHRILIQFGVTTLDERLTLIAQEAARVLNAESCSVLLAHTPDFLTLEAGFGYVPGKLDLGRRFRIQTGHRTGLTGHIAHERRVFRAHGEALTSHFATRGLPNDHKPSGQCCSLLAVPLLRRGQKRELLGLLRIENRREPGGEASPGIGFSDEDERTARIFATAMENDVLLAALEERARMDQRRDDLVNRLFAARKHLYGEMETRQLRHELTRVAVELLEYECACLYDVDDEFENVVVTAATGLPARVRGDRESLDQSVAGLVALTGTPQVWMAAELGKPYAVGGRDFPLAIGAPLRRAGGDVASVLVIAGGSTLRRFVEIDRDVLVMFADHVSTILQSSILWNWERRSFVRSSALGRIEEFIRRSPDPRKALPALLTGITAGYGLGFNRAAVFMLDEARRMLRGGFAIGHLTNAEARADWDRHEEAGMEDVGHYLTHLEAHGHIQTPLDLRVRAVQADCSPEFLMMMQTAHEDGGTIIEAAADLELFPAAVLEAYQPVPAVVLVPLVLSGDVLGFVMADNPFALKLPTFDDLKRLGRLVATAGAAIDENPEPWRLFTPDQLATLEALADRPRPSVDAGWNALADVQEQIVSAALAIFHASSAVLWTYDAAGGGSFRMEACAGLPRAVEAMVRQRPPQHGGTAYTVLESGWLPVEVVDPVRYDFLSESTREVLEAVGAHSFQGVALTLGHEQLGVLYVNYAETRPFDTADAHVALRFAERAALTLKKAQMNDVLAQVNHARKTAQVLARVSTAEPLQKVLKTVVEGTREALSGDAVTLYRYDHRSGTLLDPPTSVGVWDEPSLDAEDDKVVDGFVHRVLRGEAMRVVEDVTADEDFMDTRFSVAEKIASCVAVSLRVRQQKEGGTLGDAQPVGVMFVNFRDLHRFTREECGNIQLFADQAAIAIYNAQLHEDLRTTLRRSEAANSLARYFLVDGEWRHSVTRFTVSLRGWARLWHDRLEDAQERNEVTPEVGESLRASVNEFLELALREMSAPPVLVQADEEMEVISASDLARQAVETWNQREAVTGVNLTVALQPGEDRIYVNRQWMLRALGILIDNAVKAVAHSKHRDVVVSTRRIGATIEIDCADTGCGIPPEIVARLSRQLVSTRPAGEGMGIGLINAQNILLTYGGEVQHSSRSDGRSGTIARISLPVATEAQLSHLHATGS
ncbi:MAG TPA: GAF domain-containing protein [Longimicrobium sp.]|nr:GAF domain-containing protein [Longimicrobium sp.]